MAGTFSRDPPIAQPRVTEIRLGSSLVVAAETVGGIDELAARGAAQRVRIAMDELDVRRSLVKPDLSPAVRSRLEAVGAALAHNASVLADLLAPLISKAENTVEKKPGRCPIVPYLYRDWVWGADEVADQVARLEPFLPAAPEHAVALGGGAMRLPIEVARITGAGRMTVVERDPVLCLAVDRLLSGAELNLFELPDAPRDADCVAVQHRLRIDAGHPIDIVLGDVRSWAPGAPVDLLVTPYIIDVARQDPIELARRWSAWLAPGATWVDIGPMLSRTRTGADCVNRDELLAVLPDLGLDIIHFERFEMTHMASPYSAAHQVHGCALTVTRKQ